MNGQGSWLKVHSHHVYAMHAYAEEDWRGRRVWDFNYRQSRH